MPSNKTQIADIMHEYVTTLNNAYKYQTPFELSVAKRYPGAGFALYDVWQLISDIYENGSALANVTGFVHHCGLTGQACVDEDGGLPAQHIHKILRNDPIRMLTMTDRATGNPHTLDATHHTTKRARALSKYTTYYSS
jgi:hypothetical protein